MTAPVSLPAGWRRHGRKADLTLIPKNDLLPVQIDRAERSDLARRSRETPGSTGERDAVRVVGCIQTRSAGWICDGVRIIEEKRAAGFRHPVVVIVENHGATQPRQEAKDRHSQTAFEISRCRAECRGWIEKVGQYGAANDFAVCSALRQQRGRHHYENHQTFKHVKAIHRVCSRP